MKISYINSVCVRHDAISASVRNEIRWLSQADRHAVQLFTYACDFDDVPCRKVNQVGDIAFDPFFQSSDLVVFHFGVHYPLFDLLSAVPVAAGRIVVFHNITPKQFVSASGHDTIDKSFRQMANIGFADQVICDSQTNLAVLTEAGITTPAVVLPLAVDIADGPHPAEKRHGDGIVRLVFIGRFVRSKGPEDLIEALQLLGTRNPSIRIRLDMIGNVAFSNLEVLRQLEDAAAELRRAFAGRIAIDVRKDAPEALKQRLLAEADLFVLPTYHEGFCVPVLEAMAHGCRVITYDNSNMANISARLATLVPTGDIARLSHAIEEEAAVLHDATRDDERADHRRLMRDHLEQFSSERARARFLPVIERCVRTAPRRSGSH